jgi:2,3-bisphosphoglycerate-dependent phosphoglycerate mutase
MALTLIIARHGNTFSPNDTPRRVGLHTDIDLVDEGKAQAVRMGEYLKAQHLKPAHIYTSTLKRTISTAQGINAGAGWNTHTMPLIFLNEIDYGVDENCTDAEVIARIGKPALDAWDADATPLEGWKVNPEKIIADWHNFAAYLQRNQADNVVMCITSNGIARFAPHILSDAASFMSQHEIKMHTGALSLFSWDSHAGWKCGLWNHRP